MANIENIVKHPAFAVAGMGLLTANTILTIGVKSDTNKLRDKSDLIYNKVSTLESKVGTIDAKVNDVKSMTTNIYKATVPQQPTQQPAPVASAPVVQQPAPVVQQPAPVVQQPAPVVQQPAPVVQQPATGQQPPAQQNLVVVTGKPEQTQPAQQTGQQPESSLTDADWTKIAEMMTASVKASVSEAMAAANDTTKPKK